MLWTVVQAGKCIYLQGHILDLTHDLSSGRKKGHGAGGQVADAILLLVGGFLHCEDFGEVWRSLIDRARGIRMAG